MKIAMKWFFWLCGTSGVLLGMSAVLAGAVDHSVGIVLQGLAILFGSTIPFSVAERFRLRQSRAVTAADSGDADR